MTSAIKTTRGARCTAGVFRGRRSSVDAELTILKLVNNLSLNFLSTLEAVTCQFRQSQIYNMCSYATHKIIYAATTHNTRLEMKRAKRDDVVY